MAVSSRGRPELLIPNKWKDTETSPERTKIWTEPKQPKMEKKVAVIYYLSRNGRFEHPHFMEVPLSSPEGLYLRDVTNRLNFLRGKGMASKYSWSSKRSYKNGFVWHDLTENDFIYPARGKEYVLKGSELLEDLLSSGSQETELSDSEKQSETHKSDETGDRPVIIRRRNHSIDLQEYKVYKTEITAESARKAADASTQTDDKRRRRRTIREENDEKEKKTPVEEEESCHNQTTELSREEISPPQSSSSPETLDSTTLESLIKADFRVINGSGGVDEASIRNQKANNHHHSGRIKASTVLMQLISCGSMSTKDQGFSLLSHYRERLPRGASDQASKAVVCLKENPSFAAGTGLDDKEYFSGSLIETNKDEFSAALKRSSSYNANRSSKLDLEEKEGEGVGAKCIPRKPRQR